MSQIEGRATVQQLDRRRFAVLVGVILVLGALLVAFLSSGPAPRSEPATFAGSRKDDSFDPESVEVRNGEDGLASGTAVDVDPTLPLESSRSPMPGGGLVDNLRDVAARWLPESMHRDIGLVGVARVLEDLADDELAARWLGASDSTFERLMVDLNVGALEPARLEALRVQDKPMEAALRATQRRILQTAMSLAIEVVAAGKDIQVRPEDFDLRPGTAARFMEVVRTRQRLLDEAYPEFAGDEDRLTYISIGGSTPGIGRIIPLNRRDHRSYFAALDELVAGRARRRAEWRAFLAR